MEPNANSYEEWLKAIELNQTPQGKPLTYLTHVKENSVQIFSTRNEPNFEMISSWVSADGQRPDIYLEKTNEYGTTYYTRLKPKQMLICISTPSIESQDNNGEVLRIVHHCL